MRVTLKYLAKIALVVSVWLSGSIYAFNIENSNEAVNISGKQRMYAEKILKDYGMIALEVKFGNPKDDLDKTIKAFDEHLDALEKFNKNPKIKKNLIEEKKIWKNIKKILAVAPSKENALKLHEKIDKLVEAADKTTNLFASHTGKKSGKIINISGRQRMLSQKIAALYMMRVLGVDDKEVDEHMDKAMNLFKDSLKTLKKSSLDNKEIDEILNSVSNDFQFFEIMSRSKTKFIPSLIYNKSNDILNKMDKVTELYSKEKIQ